MTFPSQLDEQYLVGVQDVDEPTWADDDDIASMQTVDDPNDQIDQRQPVSIRKADGGIDFLNGVTEALEDMGRELMATPAPAVKGKPKLDRISTRELGSDKWRGRTAAVTANMTNPIVVQSDYRRTVRLVNLGPNVAYISSISSVAGAPNTFPLQVTTATLYAAETIETRDDVWAVCAATQSASIGIIEVFDMEP